MADHADMAQAGDEAAMQRFEEQRRRIAESMRGYDPSVPINCVDCGELVPDARLRAYPHTRRCQPCASEVERGYRQRWPA